MITDIYQHPVVQTLRRENAALTRRNEHLEDVHRIALNRDLQARALEALNPHAGGLLAPIAGGLLTIHVDAMRIRANRINQTRDPIIRIVNGDDVWHCHALTGSSFSVSEDYDRPVPGRQAAVCVLQTADPIEVIR